MIVATLASVSLEGVRIVAVAVGLVIAVATFLSAVKTVIVPRASSQFLTNLTFVAMRRMFEFVAHDRRPFKERDRVLALYAPLSLVALLLIWLLATIAGFTLIQWGLAGGSLRAAVLDSGSSMLTLGVFFRQNLPAAWISFTQATIGLVLVAMLISYLPTIYSAFSRRETAVGLLESRAGIPPSPVEMLTRYSRIGGLESIDDDLFIRFEQWFLELEESHTSFAALNFFRSPLPERSWITAAGCVLDTASLYLSVVDQPHSSRGPLCIRSGFLSLRRIAESFNLPVGPPPAPTDPISVTRREFDLMYVELVAAGVPLKEDRERAWADFQGWRVNYDRALVMLAKMVIAPPGRWSSDRESPRLVSTIRRGSRSGVREHRGGRIG